MEGAGESVLAGGRYDKLISRFDNDIPATGFGVNVSTVADTLLRYGNQGAESVTAHELVTFDGDGLGAALAYCAENKCAQLSPIAGLSENLSYARENGIAAVRYFTADGNTLTEA